MKRGEKTNGSLPGTGKKTNKGVHAGRENGQRGIHHQKHIKIIHNERASARVLTCTTGPCKKACFGVPYFLKSPDL
uniref:Uncharacterized protein n=1 Tax=Romanomermis culicivorax TaxID=13658 RepID=A0A915K1B5_ROMCU